MGEENQPNENVEPTMPMQPNENVEPTIPVQPNEKLGSTMHMQEEQNTNPMPNSQTANFNVNSGGMGPKKGKEKTILLLIAILLVLAIVIGGIYYFIIGNKPDKMYKKLVGNTIDSYTNEMTNMDYKTAKTGLKLDANIDVDGLDKNIVDLINKIDLDIDVQMDNENKKFLMNLKADYDKDDLLDVQMYSDVEKEKTYMQLENLFNKPIEVEELDNEFYTYFKEALENQKMTSEQKKSLQKAMKIVKKELMNVIKVEYCEATKEEINVNGKKVNTTKNTIKMNQKQLKNEIITVLTNLKDNGEFINCFEDKEEVSQSLENLIEQMEMMNENDKSTIEIAVYTSGLMQKIEKFEFILAEETSRQTVTVSATKTDKNAYFLEMLQNEQAICTGTLHIEEKSKNEGKVQLEIDIPNAGKIKLGIEYRQKFNENIDEVDVANSVKTNELTSEDQQTVMENLQKSKLYELIESFSGGNVLGLMGNDTDDDDNEDSSLYNDMSDDDNNDNTNATKDNEIVSYDESKKITFQIPQGYKVSYASDSYKSLEKDGVSIKISTAYGNKDDYYEDLQDTKKYYEENSADRNYKNITLSDVKTMQVNGRAFNHATFSYESSSFGASTKYETLYIWSELSDKDVIDVQVRNSEDLTSQELREILTIHVENQ